MDILSITNWKQFCCSFSLLSAYIKILESLFQLLLVRITHPSPDTQQHLQLKQELQVWFAGALCKKLLTCLYPVEIDRETIFLQSNWKYCAVQVWHTGSLCKAVCLYIILWNVHFKILWVFGVEQCSGTCILCTVERWRNRQSGRGIGRGSWAEFTVAESLHGTHVRFFANGRVHGRT